MWNKPVVNDRNPQIHKERLKILFGKFKRTTRCVNELSKPSNTKKKKKIKLTCKVPHHRVKQIKSQCWLTDATVNFHFSSKANEIFEEIICVLYTFWKVFRTSKVNNRKSRNKFYFTPGKTFVFIKLNEFDLKTITRNFSFLFYEWRFFHASASFVLWSSCSAWRLH